MDELTPLFRRTLISLCVVTHSTNLAIRWKGAAYFLPSLFVTRYANMGGLDTDSFAGEIASLRSFNDAQWCGHWNTIALQHVIRAESALGKLTGQQARLLESADEDNPFGDLGVRHASVLAAIADAGPQVSAAALFDRIRQQIPVGTETAALHLSHLTDALVKALTYFQVSAFPGHTPERSHAYWQSQRIFDRLLQLYGKALGLTIEKKLMPCGDDQVQGYLVLPSGAGPWPTVLVSNGLEGTAQELLLPLMKYRHTGMALFVMEMPGSYAYRQAMSLSSEAIYQQVIDHLASDPRLDATRLGMVGVSFGGYWAARMAARDQRLRCAVACGAPTHRTFGMAASLGIPEIIVQALRDTLGARNLPDLMGKLRQLSLRPLYKEIAIPLLVINGDHDTLVSTQDSVELAAAAGAQLLLYPGDDHCAMGHYHEWLDESQRWLCEQLDVRPPVA